MQSTASRSRVPARALEQIVATGCPVRTVARTGHRIITHRARRHTRCNRFDRGAIHRILACQRGRCFLAAADARCSHHAHVVPSTDGSLSMSARAPHLAGNTLAHSYCQRRRRRDMAIRIFPHHVEVVVEGRDLVHLRHRQAKFLRQRDQMRHGQLTVAVLDAMKVLDQQVAAARHVAKRRVDFRQCGDVHLPALGLAALAQPSKPGGLDRDDNLVHGSSVSCGARSRSLQMAFRKTPCGTPSCRSFYVVPRIVLRGALPVHGDGSGTP